MDSTRVETDEDYGVESVCYQGNQLVNVNTQMHG